MVPVFIGERFSTSSRGAGEGLGWLTTSFSELAPFMVTLLRPSLGFGDAVTWMIIASTIPTLITVLFMKNIAVVVYLKHAYRKKQNHKIAAL